MKWGRATEGPVFAAWYRDWNANTYVRSKQFREHREHSRSAGCAGERILARLISPCDAVFDWDGLNIRISPMNFPAS
jgi:hypothetical protein